MIKKLELCCLLVLITMVGDTQAGTILTADNRGWFKDDGSHQAINQNTLTGQDVSGRGTAQYRSFFVFDPSGISSPVTGTVLLRLEIERYDSPDPFETFDVFDVSTPASSLAMTFPSGSSVGTDIFDDLGTGAVYGTATAASSDVGSVIEVSLSSQASADLNAAISSSQAFAVGVRVRGPFGSTSETIRFGIGNPGEIHELVVQPIPEPTSLAIFGGLGAIGLVGVIRRRRAIELQK